MKEEADKLIEQFYTSVNSIIKEEAIICAIASTENTIRVLEDCCNKYGEKNYEVNDAINEQEKLLNELRSRL